MSSQVFAPQPLLDRQLVLGIDIGGTKTDVALSAGGDIIGRSRLNTDPDRPASTLERIAAVAADLASGAFGRDNRLGAVGVVSPGVVLDRKILLAPNLPGWQDVALIESLHQLLDVDRIAVTNDVKAAALAEADSGALQGCSPGLYINLGTGLAAALVVDGLVVDGAHGAAGEIGYVRTAGALGSSAFGQSAPLEDLIGGSALGRRASAVLGTPTTVEDLFAADNVEARHLMHQALSGIGTALANLAVFVDPARVVVGGGLMRSAEVILPILAAHLRDCCPFPPEITAAYYTTDASLHGALALGRGLLKPTLDTGDPLPLLAIP